MHCTKHTKVRTYHHWLHKNIPIFMHWALSRLTTSCPLFPACSIFPCDPKKGGRFARPSGRYDFAVLLVKLVVSIFTGLMASYQLLAQLVTLVGLMGVGIMSVSNYQPCPFIVPCD